MGNQSKLLNFPREVICLAVEAVDLARVSKLEKRVIDAIGEIISDYYPGKKIKPLEERKGDVVCILFSEDDGTELCMESEKFALVCLMGQEMHVYFKPELKSVGEELDVEISNKLAGPIQKYFLYL